jgi:hypothetical protein
MLSLQLTTNLCATSLLAFPTPRATPSLWFAGYLGSALASATALPAPHPLTHLTVPSLLLRCLRETAACALVVPPRRRAASLTPIASPVRGVGVQTLEAVEEAVTVERGVTGRNAVSPAEGVGAGRDEAECRQPRGFWRRQLERGVTARNAVSLAGLWRRQLERGVTGRNDVSLAGRWRRLLGQDVTRRNAVSLAGPWRRR